MAQAEKNHHFVIEIGEYLPGRYAVDAFSDPRQRAIAYKLYREDPRKPFFYMHRPKSLINELNGKLIANVQKHVGKYPNDAGATAVFDFSLPPLGPERDYLFVARNVKQSLVGEIISHRQIAAPYKLLHFSQARDPGPNNILTATLFERNSYTHNDKPPLVCPTTTEIHAKDNLITWSEMKKNEYVTFEKKEVDLKWTTFDIYSMNTLDINNTPQTTKIEINTKNTQTTPSTQPGEYMRHVGTIAFNPYTKEKDEKHLYKENLTDLFAGLAQTALRPMIRENLFDVDKYGEDVKTQAAKDSLQAMHAWYKGPRKPTSRFSDSTQ
jgi:hypothetical protein